MDCDCCGLRWPPDLVGFIHHPAFGDTSPCVLCRNPDVEPKIVLDSMVDGQPFNPWPPNPEA